MPLGPKSPCSTYVDHFVHSRSAKFSGVSMRQRVKRAVGACYAAKHRRTIPTQRSEEVVNELSARILKPYMKRVESDIENRERNLTNAGLKKIQNRLRFHDKAEKKVKEETQIDELTNDTLASYIVKAGVQRKEAKHMRQSGSFPKQARKLENQRTAGINQAIKKIGSQKEEVEINEVSKNKLKAYVRAAEKDKKKQLKKPLSDDKSNKKFANRTFGLIDAKKRLEK